MFIAHSFMEHDYEKLGKRRDRLSDLPTQF